MDAVVVVTPEAETLVVVSQVVVQTEVVKVTGVE
jgi:hypothetical protein